MFIEIPNLTDKKLIKLINNINEDYEREKWNKFETHSNAVIKWLKKESNTALYILSLIAEEMPESFSHSIFADIDPYIKGDKTKEKINAVIIYGSCLLNFLSQEDYSDMTHLNGFLELLYDSKSETRQNICFFLEQFPDSFDTQLLLKLNIFIKILEDESNSEVLKTTQNILSRLQPKMSLIILIKYIQQLRDIYENNKSAEISDIILNLIEKEIPLLKKRENSNWSKNQILREIDNRPTLIRFTDLNIISEQENLSLEEVENYLLSQIDEDTIYTLVFIDKNHKKLLELEKEKIISFLSQRKIKLDEIVRIFNDLGIKNNAVVMILIKSMLEKHIIRGYFTKKYYYDWSYLKKEFLQRLQQYGSIDILNYSKSIDKDTIHKLINEIETQGILGIYNLEKSKYHTFSAITQEIEKESYRSNIIDLSPYKSGFTQENFYKLEEYCRTKIFTKYHYKHSWLTHLGTTNIQQELRICEQIGECNVEQRAEKLGIHPSILHKITKKIFEHKNGFWNKEEKNFYFSKYVKKRISSIQNELDAVKREKLIDSLADELQVDKDEISQKVDEKLNKIGKMLSEKDEFLINPLLRDLQMDQKEFLKFVDSLEKPDGYLIIHDKIIFSKKRIDEEQNKLSQSIKENVLNLNVMKINELVSKYKCSSHILINILENLLKNGEISGLWIKENEKFLTERGIQERMIEAKSYIDLNSSVIEEITLSEEGIMYLEKILLDLMEQKRLTGVYDQESHVFQSDSILGDADLDNEREHFKKEISPFLEDLERTYIMLRDILLQNDILPNDIDSYEEILEETIRKILQDQSVLKRIINNANNRINKSARKSVKTKTRRDKKEDKDEKIFKNFANDEIIASLMNDFNNWKTLLYAIEQKAGEIVFLKKKLKSDPEDSKNKEKLNQILEYLGFSD
nr:hypothetical protein [Candidatus Prometheoarchaeum syntrophicum]QEE16123.1 hypothetical protein DSAG12_01952 [Candidatus Prometheoarchaeum syntrophicum]